MRFLIDIGTLYGILAASIVCIIYLIMEIKGHKETDSLFYKPACRLLIITSVIELFFIIIISLQRGEISCAEDDTSCLIYIFALFILTINLFLKSLIFSIFSKIRSKKNNISIKYNPIIIWVVVVVLVLLIPFATKQYKLAKHRQSISGISQNIDITFLNSKDKLPSISKGYTNVAVENEFDNIYDNFGKFKHKKIRMSGYTYNELSGDYDDLYFLTSNYIKNCFDEYNRLATANCANKVFKIMFTANNSVELRNELYSTNGTKLLYMVIEGTIDIAEEGCSPSFEDCMGIVKYVYIKPERVFVIKDKSIYINIDEADY